MPTPIYQIGRKGRVYAAVEATYGVAPGLAATDAVRHLNVSLNRKQRNRVNAPTRHVHPSQVYRRTRRGTADWIVGGEFFPAGVLNTLPDHSDFLEHGIGTKTNVTLGTTVSATPAPTATVFTVASVTGLVVRDAILINIAAGPSAGKYVRWISAIDTLQLTIEPALPAAPAAGDAVKGCITYKPATDLAKSLNIGHYLESISFQGYGAVVDQLRITFDANNEVMWEASGPMMKRTKNGDAGHTPDPATFTVVGTTPPSGLTGELTFNGTEEDYLRAEFAISNAMALDNYAAGTSLARAFYRKGKRAVTVGVDSMVSDDVTMLTAADLNGDATVLVQSGDTEGSIIAVYCPIVELEELDHAGDSDEELNWKYSGLAKATIAGNNEIYVAVA